jgi:hypothetical protein
MANSWAICRLLAESWYTFLAMADVRFGLTRFSNFRLWPDGHVDLPNVNWSILALPSTCILLPSLRSFIFSLRLYLR